MKSNLAPNTLLLALSRVALICCIFSAAVAAEENADALNFEHDVRPIFQRMCMTCHGGIHRHAELDLRTLPNLMKGSENGSVLVPGKPEESLLWEMIASDEMPDTKVKVSDADKALIKAWIAAGAKSLPAAEPQVIRSEPRSVAEAAALIDKAIDARLSHETISASPPADDAEFLRRAYLDIVGRIPSAAEADAFLDSADTDKRDRLIEELLARPEYGRPLAAEWVHLFTARTANSVPAPADTFIDWLADGLNEGRGWDALMRDVITASGTLEDQPQGIFHYYNGDMIGNADVKVTVANVSQIMLGIQLQCAECHDHPYSDFSQDDFWSLTAFFSTMRTRKTLTPDGVIETQLLPPDHKRHTEPSTTAELVTRITGDEARNTGRRVAARFLDGTEPKIEHDKSYRELLARWLTAAENPWFARAAVNRLWAHFFGRGLVEPLDDFNISNPASHPAVLDLITEEFVASGFDVRHVIRVICTTRAYQRTSRPLPDNKLDARLLSHMHVKVMTPESLYDSQCQALEVDALELVKVVDPPKRIPKGTVAPTDPRSQCVGELRKLGVSEDPTDFSYGVPQSLRLLNHPTLNGGGEIVKRIAAKGLSTNEAIGELFLAALSRRPTTEEVAEFTAFIKQTTKPEDAYRRMLWALLNSGEFILIR